MPWAVSPLSSYVASRVVGAFALYMVRFVLPGVGVVAAMTRWDAAWYLTIAEDGYPSSLPPADSPNPATPLGFFPLYPLLIRALAAVSPLGLPAAAVVVNTVAGGVAAVLVWKLAHDVFDRDTADRAALLFSFFPGAYALSMAYTEGLFIACGAGCLLLLHHRRFWWAALVAGIGSASRPTGYVLALACAFAVVAHWRETGDWKPLPSPVPAAGGLLAFLVYLHVHTGDAFAWQRAQEQGWGQTLGLQDSALARAFDYVTGPIDELNIFLPVFTTLVMIPLVWLLVRTRPPGAWLVFVGAGLVPSMLSTSVSFTPRHLFALFPLVVALARHLRGWVFSATLATCAGIMAWLVFVIGATRGVVP